MILITLTSEGILLTTSTIGQIDELNAVYREACAYFSFDQGRQMTDPAVCIERGDLPPNGIRENFHILSIYWENQLVGYVSFYEGYPNDKVAYICFIYLLDSVKRRRLGTTIVNLLCDYFVKKEFYKIRIAVSLKNWTALHFWLKNGFDRITLVSGDTKFSVNNHGCIELERDIT